MTLNLQLLQVQAFQCYLKFAKILNCNLFRSILQFLEQENECTILILTKLILTLYALISSTIVICPPSQNNVKTFKILLAKSHPLLSLTHTLRHTETHTHRPISI